MDIDKAYMMSYRFDNNGKFEGWSDIFDYSSFATLEASLELPIPKGILIETSNKDNKFDIDITQELLTIHNLKSNNVPQSIRELAKLITKIEKVAEHKKEGESVIIKRVPDELYYLIRRIQTHEDTNLPDEIREHAVLNAVSARIQYIANHPDNALLAYSPITMKTLLDIAATSPKGNLVLELTGMDPITKYIMQCLNMTGKTVIGIAAVGEKVFMGLSYYFNDGIRSKDNNRIRRLMFSNKTTRIYGRSGGNPVTHYKHNIADINWEDNEVKARVGLIALLLLENPLMKGETNEAYNERILSYVNNKNHTDLLISQLLSAATDNAKELILDKINSGEATANIYLHLLILGYSMNDIAAFMISPAASVLSDVMNSSMYNPYHTEFNVAEGIKIAKTGYNLEDYIDKSESIEYSPDERMNDLLELYLDLLENVDNSVLGTIRSLIQKIFGFTKINPKTNEEVALKGHEVDTALYDYINKNNYLEVRETISKMLNDNTYIYTKPWLDKKLKKMIYDFYMQTEALALSREDYLTKAYNDPKTRALATLYDFNLDLDELDKIRQDADETTTLGQLFGLNREVKPEFSLILAKINTIESKVDTKVNKYRLKDFWGKPETSRKLVDLLMQEHPDYSRTEIENILKNAEDIIKNGFSFEKFASRTQDINQQGKTYREVAIDLYDLIKSQYNILDIMDKHPQYRSAMETWIIGHLMLKVSSAKASIADIIRQDLKQAGIKISEKLVNGLFNYAEDLIITKWMRERLLSFPLMHGQLYIGHEFLTSTNTAIDTWNPILTSQDASSYKLWFELYFVPQLMSGKVQTPDGEIKIDTNNRFVKALVYGEEHNKPVYKLNLLMDLIDDNINAAKLYQGAVLDLANLPQKLLDYIMLYNIFVTHNAPGNDRFANVFSGLLNNKNKETGEDSLLLDYLKYVGNFDWSMKNVSLKNQKEHILSELGYTIADSEFKIAPEYYEGHIPQDNKARIIILRKKNGTKVYMEKDGKGWKSFTDYKFYDSSSTESNNERLFNFLKYGLLYLPNVYDRNVTQSILDSHKVKDVADLIKRLIKQQKLIITRVC